MSEETKKNDLKKLPRARDWNQALQRQARKELRYLLPENGRQQKPKN